MLMCGYLAGENSWDTLPLRFYDASIWCRPLPSRMGPELIDISSNSLKGAAGRCWVGLSRVGPEQQ